MRPRFKPLSENEARCSCLCYGFRLVCVFEEKEVKICPTLQTPNLTEVHYFIFLFFYDG
jgi:hypothetical protein